MPASYRGLFIKYQKIAPAPTLNARIRTTAIVSFFFNVAACVRFGVNHRQSGAQGDD
jgi:hypothetical protein